MGRLQQGSVLMISLVCLLLLMLVGVSGMKLTSLDERMSGNYRDREMAFQAAEAALVEAENFIESTPWSQQDLFSPCAGTGDKCFTSDCTGGVGGGLCFTGTFPSSSNPVNDCKLDSARPWEDWTRWDTPAQVKEATTLAGLATQAKYIIEYRCFTVRDPLNTTPDKANIAEWALLFRITALSNGGSSDSRIMLQSTYKKLDF